VEQLDIGITKDAVIAIISLSLMIGSNFVPNSGVKLDDMFSGKYVYGSPEFHYASRNWWISYLMAILGVVIFVGGILYYGE